MLTSGRTGRPPGRPRLNRQLHQYNPRIEQSIAQALQDRAELLQVTLGRFLSLLVSEAHDYTGSFTPQVRPELGTRTPMPVLRERVAALRSEDCLPAPAGPSVRPGIRVDKPLAEQINEKCRALDVAYESYLRSVLYEACGVRSQPYSEQLALLPHVRGEGAA